MRKLFITIIGAAIAITSCNKFVEMTDDESIMLFAQIEEEKPTRTTLDEDNNVLWSEGDQIVAFLRSSLPIQYELASESVGKTYGRFQRVGSSDNGDLNAGGAWDHIIAYYPYSKDIDCKKSGNDYMMTIILPSSQTYVPESFSAGAFPMVAVSEDNNITFNNILGGIKLQIKGTQKVTSVKIEGKNNEKLAGQASLKAYTDGSKPDITMSTGAVTSVTLDCGAGVQLNESAATEFIIALPPVSFERGFTVTITDSDNKTHIVETDKANSVLRSSLLTMPDVTIKSSESEQPSLKKIDYIDEYGINHGQGVEIDGVIWAPVNCGYHSTDYKYGKLYQWGRKYGQGYNSSDASVPSIVEGPVSLSTGQSESNSNKFYKVVSELSDWVTPQNTKLWNSGTEEDPIKTEYDPCPDGWRVPTESELNDLKLNHSSWTTKDGQSGFWFSGSTSYPESVSSVFFPAAGYRHANDGKSRDREEDGRYWASSPFVNYANVLCFYNSSSYIGGEFRGLGYSIRCVQEECLADMPVEPGQPSEPQNGDYVDEYGINHGQGVEIDGVIWAPVNCGYHATDYKYGKLYQWGRKYGQGYEGYIFDEYGNSSANYSDAQLPSILDGPVSISEGRSSSNANVFFTSESSYDWLTPQDNDLWNLGTEEDPIKTEYDPCPDGWRVPTCAELEGLAANYSSWCTNEDGQPGYWFSGAQKYSSSVPSIFLPAAGERYTNGLSDNQRGLIGYYWSSKEYSFSWYSDYEISRNIAFTSGVVYSYNFSSRAYGNSIRCVKDSNSSEDSLIPVTELVISDTSLDLYEGGTAQLTATVRPNNATDKTVIWSSDNPSVASVDQTGLVTAKTAGTATITVTTQDGGKRASCTVYVTSAKPSVSVRFTNISFAAGGTMGFEGSYIKVTEGVIMYVSITNNSSKSITVTDFRLICALLYNSLIYSTDEIEVPAGTSLKFTAPIVMTMYAPIAEFTYRYGNETYKARAQYNGSF